MDDVSLAEFMANPEKYRDSSEGDVYYYVGYIDTSTGRKGMVTGWGIKGKNKFLDLPAAQAAANRVQEHFHRSRTHCTARVVTVVKDS